MASSPSLKASCSSTCQRPPRRRASATWALLAVVVPAGPVAASGAVSSFTAEQVAQDHSGVRLAAALPCEADGVAALAANAIAAAEEAQAALYECQRELGLCQSAAVSSRAGGVRPRSSTQAPGSRAAPPWPKGYGQLLRFPFGLADMKALKDYARAIWQPDGTAASITDSVTDKGFVRLQGSRCTSEMVGVHPVGGVGHRWSVALWEAAQDWCLGQPNCTAIMLYVGNNTLNCHHWCGRPQFCHEVVSEQGGTEPNGAWNLFVRAPA